MLCNIKYFSIVIFYEIIKNIYVGGIYYNSKWISKSIVIVVLRVDVNWNYCVFLIIFYLDMLSLDLVVIYLFVGNWSKF